MDQRLVDQILDFKTRCLMDEQIGKAYNLTPREVNCLLTAVQTGALSSKELSLQIGLSPSRGSRVISGLLDKGLLQAEINQGDRRYHTIQLTQEGISCIKTIEKEKNECERALLEKLRGSDVNQIKEGIEILLKIL